MPKVIIAGDEWIIGRVSSNRCSDLSDLHAVMGRGWWNCHWLPMGHRVLKSMTRLLFYKPINIFGFSTSPATWIVKPLLNGGWKCPTNHATSHSSPIVHLQHKGKNCLKKKHNLYIGKSPMFTWLLWKLVNMEGFLEWRGCLWDGCSLLGMGYVATHPMGS